jgi:hypothetical protein
MLDAIRETLDAGGEAAAKAEPAPGDWPRPQDSKALVIARALLGEATRANSLAPTWWARIDSGA